MKRQINALIYVSEALQDNTVSPLLENLSKYHYDTYIHSLHVTFVAVQIGIQCRMNDSKLKVIAKGSLLHDIGKTKVPIEILDKKETLTESEIFTIKEHPKSGYAILKDNGLSEEICKIALLHHRKLNGTGYPNIGDAEVINDIIQVVEVADIFEAIVTTRAYKEKIDINNAIKLLKESVLMGELEKNYVSVLENLARKNRLLLQTI